MNRPAYLGFVSNAGPKIRSRIVESLVTVWNEDKSVRPVIVNFDTGISIRKNNGRSSNEDPIMRYGNAMGSTGVPVLQRAEAADFFDDAAKPKNSALVDGRTFLTLMDDVPPPDAVTLFDALCFAVTLDHASIAYVYGAVKSMEAARKKIPTRIMVVGESKIENAAEFYASLVTELKNVGQGFAELSFAGLMSFDQEESDLAAAYGVPLIEAFPESVLRGQVKYAIRKLFANDSSESDADWPETEKRFARVARIKKT